jgi:3'-5' exoribonuclease
VEPIRELREMSRRVLHSVPETRVAEAVLGDPRFLEAIASSSHHPESHQVPGGLVVHTLEVAREAVRMAGDDRKLARLVFVAAVYHDIGKIHEYALMGGKVVKLPFAKLCGHVVWGWDYFLAQAAAAKLSSSDTAAIGHGILAHMGRKEWGSPVEPATRLAFILHTADMLSAKGLA